LFVKSVLGCGVKRSNELPSLGLGSLHAKTIQREISVGDIVNPFSEK